MPLRVFLYCPNIPVYFAIRTFGGFALIYLNPVTIYYFIRGIFALCTSMGWVLAAVYFVQTIGMSPLELVLLGTALEVSAFLFEIPTGVVADTYSRKLSVIIGFSLFGGVFVAHAFFPYFIAILLLQIPFGLAWTFISGALEAWIADETEVEQTGQAYLRASQVGTVCGLVGTITGTILGLMQLTFPFIAAGALMLGLSVFLIFFMPEKGFKPTAREGENALVAMGSTFRAGFKLARNNRTIITIMAIAVFYGAFTEGFDRLGEAHFLKNHNLPPIGDLNPTVWFGIFGVGSVLFNLIVTEIVRRKVDTNSHIAVARVLLFMSSGLVISVIVFGLAGNFWLAVLAYWSIGILRGIHIPLWTSWLNQNLVPETRATVLSMGNQADALGQMFGGPVLGLIANGFSIGAAMVVSALLLTPALWLYGRTLQGRKIEADEKLVEVAK
jgi:DHA3 family tetracycline resistance protein-like MFS transporter